MTKTLYYTTSEVLFPDFETKVDDLLCDFRFLRQRNEFYRQNEMGIVRTFLFFRPPIVNPFDKIFKITAAQ